MEEERELKKVQEIALSYYSRKDVQNAIYDFCQNRETVPRYLEGFGKRPDALDFPNDILNSAKKGATSFHCSEEIWDNPMRISTDMTPMQYNDLRSGWDMLIDIDSKYLDYSKIAAELLVKVLEYHGVNNVGVKYSGSKGMHIIIPWKAFPKEVDGIETKNMFPEWPRAVAEYLQEMIHDKLTERILQTSSEKDIAKKGKEIYETKCKKCGNLAKEQKINNYKCKKCKAEMKSTHSTRKTLRCPGCNGMMDNLGEEIYLVCETCKISSNKNPDNFETKATIKQLIETVDLVLVAPRHLFRTPYSLHEKTALASIVIDKKDIPNFQPNMADPLKVQIKQYTPDSQEGEARELLLQALDWQKKKQKPEKKFTGSSIDVKNLTIKEEMFPECIRTILSGIKQDGRKRSLFILLAFFRSLELPRGYMEERVDEWNKKNYKPLKEGYIRSQIDWIMKNKIMPPNCSSHYYKELGIKCNCQNIKNPISYTIKNAMRFKR